MKSRFRNIFLVFGIVAVVIMLFTFDVSYEDLSAVGVVAVAGYLCH